MVFLVCFFPSKGSRLVVQKERLRLQDAPT